jgi:catechol 2,3-dioxygenase-like lactoylglutathione lyase family enzyme
MDRERPVARGVHVGFRAPNRAAVDAFWQAGVDAGYPDAGAPGPRTIYGPDYYGGFLLDPDGHRIEAVYGDRERPVPDGRIDHLWLRVRNPLASRRFYTTIAQHAGLRLAHDAPDRVQFRGEDYTFSLLRDEQPLTEHVHLAFPADADTTVQAFHAAALAAGYEDHGTPGERAVYHPGYYGAFILDPDGHNVEVVNHNRWTAAPTGAWAPIRTTTKASRDQSSPIDATAKRGIRWSAWLRCAPSRTPPSPSRRHLMGRRGPQM